MMYALHYSCEVSTSFGVGENAVIYYANNTGIISLNSPNTGSFIPYSDVTEANAVGWCEAALGTGSLQETEANLNTQLSESITPTKGNGLPW